MLQFKQNQINDKLENNLKCEIQICCLHYL